MPFQVRFVADGRSAAWDRLKAVLADDTECLTVPAVNRLSDTLWLEFHGIKTELLAEPQSFDSGIGKADGSRLQFEMTSRYCFSEVWAKDIILQFFKGDWTPETIYPYRLALEEALLARLTAQSELSYEAMNRLRIQKNLVVRLEGTDSQW